MMLDKQATLSEEQAVTDSANSTDVYDQGVSGGDLGAGQPLMFEALLTETFTGATSVEIQLVGADNSALTTNVAVIETSGAIPVADLLAGSRFSGTINLHEPKQYIGFKYVVVGGPATEGAVTSFINLDVHAYRNYPANYVVHTN